MYRVVIDHVNSETVEKKTKSKTYSGTSIEGSVASSSSAPQQPTQTQTTDDQMAEPNKKPNDAKKAKALAGRILAKISVVLVPAQVAFKKKSLEPLSEFVQTNASTLLQDMLSMEAECKKVLKGSDSWIRRLWNFWVTTAVT